MENGKEIEVISSGHQAKPLCGSNKNSAPLYLFANNPYNSYIHLFCAVMTLPEDQGDAKCLRRLTLETTK